MAATTLSVSGGFTSLLEKIEDRYEKEFEAKEDLIEQINDPVKRAEYSEALDDIQELFDTKIDLLQSQVTEDDTLVIGHAGGTLPPESISLAFEGAVGTDPSLEDLYEVLDPIVFGGAEEGDFSLTDLVGLISGDPKTLEAFKSGDFNALGADSDFEDRFIDDLFPGGSST